MVERYSTNRLPSVHSKKILNSSTDLYELKTNIEQSFNLKNCKLASVKVIEENV